MNQYILDEDENDDKEIQLIRQQEKSNLGIKAKYSAFLKMAIPGITATFCYFNFIRPFISPNEKPSLSLNQVLPVLVFFGASLIGIKVFEFKTLRKTRQVIERVNHRRDRRKLAFESALFHAERTPSKLGTQQIPKEAKELIFEFAGLSELKKGR